MRTLLLLLTLYLPLLVQAGALESYKPRFGREQPLVAVVGENRMTELVDYLVPFSLLSRAGVAEVVALSTREGPLQMMPALRVEAQVTTAEFEQRYPQGADYLIVPAVHHSDDPVLTAFVAGQAAREATIVGICDGVLVLGHAGLLHGRQATGHWYSKSRREADFPDTHWQVDRRYVVDGKLVTSSGVSAALPVSLALVEAIAGPLKAEALGREIGLTGWSPAHNSQSFAFGAGGYLTAAANHLAFWRHETLSLPLQPGLDEATLALRVDAWARSFRTEVLASGNGPVRSRHGLTLLPDAPAEGMPLLPDKEAAPGKVLDEALAGIAARYGDATAAFVAAQLEYPRH
ncbi:transcriptional regulator [Metapseudomonas lalkuanensis]|uniref:Transcriptional regulator n=1 Tax=Metapseudomonas lalkuanensis TaxID=2604832 RepID=A0A5J6QUB8_9GAMM|nr:DJ-1/PfpI family protein [Pseudomonas lalkuanensis]QEY64911.1 transcriptional regulator [Pseudomonas lalkuanensis]